MSFQWILQEPEDEKVVATLTEELNIIPVLARLLALRKVTTYDEAKLFFRPSLDDLYDPFLMKDMDIAAPRLAKAIRNSETIVVYGDYDVDGTTATAIMYTFLKGFGCDVRYYIPHRFKEGYGINPDGIEFASSINAHLIVSVDCGITAIDEAELARSKGLDLIICDHHTALDTIPNALAVLDPKRPDCSYPFDGLSGAGVGFKLIQGTLKELGLPASKAWSYLDLLAISIASDIVPIIDENRILMREGLKILNEHPRPGVKALQELINLENGNLNTNKIVFSIGPRINAAGRLGDAKTAVELLIAEEETEARAASLELEAINIRRRSIDSTTMELAIGMLDETESIEKMSSLILHHPDWHLGVIGIVASRLVDKYHRPSIMLSTVDGLAKGSARSIRGFNIYDALKECEDLLIQFGGHEYAAGLTLAEENLDAFKERFSAVVERALHSNEFNPELLIDSELSFSEIDGKFWRILRQFEPFGPINMKPLFISRGVFTEGTPSIVGNGHLKFRVSQKSGQIFDAIGFNMHEFLPVVRDGVETPFDLAYTIEENKWNGRISMQLRVKDIHPIKKDE